MPGLVSLVGNSHSGTRGFHQYTLRRPSYLTDNIMLDFRARRGGRHLLLRARDARGRADRLELADG
jgi:hypothetical protein